MGKVRDELELVRFHCRPCDYRFDAAPARVDDAPEDAWHPWRYAAPCPECGRECGQDAQQRGLLKAWASATGPKTAEGKAAAAANLDGHPTPEEAQRTRFNGLKHGLTARTATFWPARPGKYPDCDGCEFFNSCFGQVACQKRLDLYFRHHLAFVHGDPGILTDLNADLHANLRALVNLMILDVIKDGATVRTPAWYYDKDGGFHLARDAGKGADEHGEATEGVGQIMELREHPMLKRIGEWVSRLGLSLSDMGMTPKAKETAEETNGYLSAQQQSQENLLAYQERQALALEGLTDMIQRARDKAAADPVMIEHKQQGGDDA